MSRVASGENSVHASERQRWKGVAEVRGPAALLCGSLGGHPHISHTVASALRGFPRVSRPCPPTPHLLCAGEVQAFYEDLNGRQYVNEVFNFSVDKLYDLLFTDSPFQRDFMEQRRFSGPSRRGLCLPSLPSPCPLPSPPKRPPFPGSWWPGAPSLWHL